MRKADDVETLTWHGHEVTVETWFEQCAFPWDGDGEAPDCEGVDLLVEVTLCPDDTHTFKAYGSLGGVYGDRAYVRECVYDLVQEALSGLQTELEAVAAGRDVLTAHARQALAARLLGAGVAYATPTQFATIEARAYNDTARDMQRRGVRLTYEQADALGQGALDWLHTRLGLRVSETDAGVIGEVV